MTRPVEVGTALVTTRSESLPALIAKTPRPVVFQRQAQFESLMETRGTAPDPSKFRYRFWSHGAAWGPALAGVAVAIGFPVASLVAAPLAIPAIVAGSLLLVGSVIGGPLNKEIPSPLSAFTRLHHLNEDDLQFIGHIKEASEIDRAVVGILAERWVQRIDNQRVHGEEAYAILEDLIAARKTLPEDVQQRARKLVTLLDTTVDWRTKQPYKALSDDNVKSIINAFTDLDPEDRASCGAELMKRYFKGEVERHDIGSHGSARKLYRTLRNGVKDPLALPAPAQD